MLANLVGFVTRREGKKFLKLSEKIDEAIITVAELGGDDAISL